MTHLVSQAPHTAPSVLQAGRVGDTWRFTLRVPEDSDLFAGHFPGLPVLPGVAQLHWALALWREHGGDSRPLRGLRRLKFQRIVGPGDVLQLECRMASADVVAFTFRRAGANGQLEAVSGGQCVLDGSAPGAGPGPAHADA